MKGLDVILVAPAGSGEARALRQRLRAAMEGAGMLAVWRESLCGAEDVPVKYRSVQGAFVLVDGKLLEDETVEGMVKQLGVIQKKRARWAWVRRPLSAGSVVPGILLAFFPKCAGCWAAYFSVFNSMGVGNVPYLPWMKHVLAATLVLSLIYFVWLAQRRGRWLPLVFQGMGIGLVILAQYVWKAPVVNWVGVGSIFVGSLLTAMPEVWMRRGNRIFRII